GDTAPTTRTDHATHGTGRAGHRAVLSAATRTPENRKDSGQPSQDSDRHRPDKVPTFARLGSSNHTPRGSVRKRSIASTGDSRTAAHAPIDLERAGPPGIAREPRPRPERKIDAANAQRPRARDRLEIVDHLLEAGAAE